MHARSVHYREEQIYYTCWATGSNIDSIVLVWNTGIFSAQKLIPTPVLAETKQKGNSSERNIREVYTPWNTQPRTKMSKSGETTALFPGDGTADVAITRPRLSH